MFRHFVNYSVHKNPVMLQRKSVAVPRVGISHVPGETRSTPTLTFSIDYDLSS